MHHRNILITGASSGIGAALARVFADPNAHLVLWGRDAARLEATARDCRARGAIAVCRSFDLTDFAALPAALEEADDAQPVDLVIFNAGLGGSLPRDHAAQEAKAVERMAGVNFMAPVIGANVMAERMATRRCGRIVLVGSIAARFPLPMAPVYSGSKAGIAMFADALRGRMKRYGVGVSLISPGFIDTPMSQSVTEAKPFMISADRAARIIARKLAHGARHIVVPWQYAAIGALANFVPGAIVRAVLAKF